MTMDKHTRTSRPVVTPFKKVNKKLMSKEESERQKSPYRRYTVGGGDDIA
jgi:hypothetical protein